MKFLKIPAGKTLRFLGCVAVGAVITQQIVGAWNTTRHVPYFGYYYIESSRLGFNHVDEVNGYANFAQIIMDEDVAFTPSVGAQFDNAGISVFVQINVKEDWLNNPMDTPFQAYLTDVQTELTNANLWDNVVAVAPVEEWHDRVAFGEVGTWATFSGINVSTHPDCTEESAPEDCWISVRRNLLVSKLNNVIAAIENKYGKPSLLVDTQWNDEYYLGDVGNPRNYYPVPSNLDILGLSAYMDRNTPPAYSSECNSAMQQKFNTEVKWNYDHALAMYSQPILIVGQAFNTEDPDGGGWPMASPCQMNWWYGLAQSSPRFFGLVWFAYGLNDEPGTLGEVGVRSYPDGQMRRNWLRNMYLHNQCIATGQCPDTLSSATSLLPGHSRTSIDGRFQLVYQGDGNLVLYGPSGYLWDSGTVGTSPGQAAMQGDGNFVIYDSGGTPIWWTATDGNPGAYLAVQPDGNVVIYPPHVPAASLWNTGTSQ